MGLSDRAAPTRSRTSSTTRSPSSTTAASSGGRVRHLGGRRGGDDAGGHPPRSRRARWSSSAPTRGYRGARLPGGDPARVDRAFLDADGGDWGRGDMHRLGPRASPATTSRRLVGPLLRSGASPGASRRSGACTRSSTSAPLLPLVAAPTLVIYREDDRLVPPPLSQAVAEGIPDAREVELRGRRPPLLRRRPGRVPRRGRGVPHRPPRRAEPRPGARDGAVHRHRRLDRARRRARRPPLARAARRSTTGSSQRELERHRGRDGQDRPATACSRPSTAPRGRSAARRRDPRRRAARSGSRCGRESTPASAS